LAAIFYGSAWRSRDTWWIGLVGLSLNLNKILAYAALPIRAMIALILLPLVLIVSSIVLIPTKS